MAILLTGGTGYIGSHIAVELLQSGYEVIIADNFSNSTPETAARIQKITGINPVVIEMDLTDKTALENVFSSNVIEAVIHLAGFKAVAESVREPLRYYSNNLISTINLLEVMALHGVKKIIFSSSATVYGTSDKLPYTEEMPHGICASPYGSTKQMIERIIMDAAAADSGLSAVLLRYFNPAGAHPSGLIGEMPNGVPNNLMPYITQVAKGKLPVLNIFGNDYPTRDGTCVRDYIHVVDLAKGHVSALKYCADHEGIESFNLGTGEGTSVSELVDIFERVNAIKIPHVIATRREGDLPEYYADAAKAERVLEWKAELTPEDMCRDAWNWEKNL